MNNRWWKKAAIVLSAMDAVDSPEYQGLAYIHLDGAKATHVLMTLDRFQEVAGGHDPGHDDSFAHGHVYP